MRRARKRPAAPRFTGTPAQQAYVKASNTGADDEFGISVALSSDGNTLAVGANLEDSALTGVTAGSPTNATTGDGAGNSGAAYVFFGAEASGDSGGPSIGVTINGLSLSSTEPIIISETPQGAPVQLAIEVNEIEGKELFFVLNAPALGIYWSYLNNKNQWIPVPTNWAAIQPFRLAPANGRHSLFGTQTLPTGSYEFYLGFDERVDGYLNIVGGGILDKFVQRTVQVQ